MMALSKAFGLIFDFSDCADYKMMSSILMICMHSLGKKKLYSLPLFLSALPFLNQIIAMKCWACSSAGQIKNNSREIYETNRILIYLNVCSCIVRFPLSFTSFLNFTPHYNLSWCNFVHL